MLGYLKKPLIAVYRRKLLWMVKCEQNCLVGSGGDFKEGGKKKFTTLHGEIRGELQCPAEVLQAAIYNI